MLAVPISWVDTLTLDQLLLTLVYVLPFRRCLRIRVALQHGHNPRHRRPNGHPCLQFIVSARPSRPWLTPPFFISIIAKSQRHVTIGSILGLSSPDKHRQILKRYILGERENQETKKPSRRLLWRTTPKTDILIT